MSHIHFITLLKNSMKKIVVTLFVCICFLKNHSQIISTLAGAGGSNGYNDGPSNIAKFSSPTSIATHTNGDVYVADPINNIIRKISGGYVTTFCGTGVAGNTDGNSTTATLDHPKYITIDQYGNLYVSARDRVRQIDPSGNISTVITPTAIASSIFLNGRLGELAYDKTNNFLYAADSSGRFLKFSGGGVINFTNIYGIAKSMAVDPINGGFYYISTDNNVYKVLSSGLHNIFLNAHSGNAIDVKALNPSTIEIYIAGDTASNQTINIYSVAGFLQQGRSMLVKNPGDVNGVAKGSACHFVSDIKVDNATNSIYLADFNNNKIKFIESANTPTSSLNYLLPTYNYTVCPNTTFSLSPNANASHYNWVYNGTALTNTSNISVSSNTLTINQISSTNTGTYTLYYGNTYMSLSADYIIYTKTVSVCSASASSNSICLGQSIDLIGCNGTNSYNWTGSNGYTFNNFYAIDYPSTTTTYTFTENDGDCDFELAVVTVSVNNCSVGINDLKEGTKWQLYPNPATDFISINLDIKPINGTKVCIINALGEVVLSEIVKTQNTTLYINDLIDGVYFIKLESNKGIITKKFIKQ